MDLTTNPLTTFEEWYQQALKSDEADPSAMALATATLDGKPSVRIVLYKGLSQGGFLIYTNYDSRKGMEMLQNPFVSFVIYWPRCYRQVRVEGHVERISAELSEQYFSTRPRGSQIAASISEQSHAVPDRNYLLEKYAEFELAHKDQSIACPEDWGGYRIIPDVIEFWQGQEHRLHDRYCYRKQKDGWSMTRLAP